MSARLHLCGPDALERLAPMVAAFHGEQGIDTDVEGRARALAPLLKGSPYGAVFLIGPERAPVGYLVVTFTWSIEFGGMEAVLDEVWIRPAVRRRGMGSEALETLTRRLADEGVMALSLEAERDSPAEHFYRRHGFAMRDRYITLSRMM
ncbi:MAG: GNAT family N-acetyltransferase [Pseudomonadota bacterium]